MSKAKLKVEVKTGAQGPKVAESKAKVVVAQATNKPKGKPVYQSKAKLNTHLRVGRKR